MGFARHQKHAQPVADARYGDHGMVVLLGQFGRAWCCRQFHQIFALMRHGHADVRILAHRHQARAERLAIDADIQHGAGFAAAAQIVDPEAQHRPLPDNGEARRVQHGQLAVTLAARSCHQHLQRGMQRKRFGRGRVMHLAIGDQDGAGHPSRRHIGQRRVQGTKGLGAIVLAGRGGGDAGFAHDQARLLRQQPLDLGPRGFGLLAALAQRHALRAVGDDHGHIGQRGVFFLHQQGAGQGKQQYGKRQSARPGTLGAQGKAVERDGQGQRTQDRQQGQRNDGVER